MLIPKITVVLGCFNQKDTLQKVLQEYDNQTLSKDLFEVVVVDSSSTDGTGQFFQDYKPTFNFRGIVQENKGKAAARNRGVNEASSRFIIITDSDMIPHQDFVKAHLDAQLNSKKPSCFEGLAWNLESLSWPQENEKMTPQVKPNPKSMSRLGWYYFLTGNISFPKQLFDTYNGFDEDFGGYGWEDLELGYRLSKNKVPLYYLKSAINYHYHVITEKEDISRQVKKGESAQIFLKKHPELKWFLGLNPLSVFIRKRLDSHHFFVRYIQEKCYGESQSIKHRFGRWFLKEYNYLSGILSLPHIDLERKQ